MNRPRPIILIVAAVVAAGVVVYRCIPKEPRYHDRKLSEWTAEIWDVWTNFDSGWSAHRAGQTLDKDPRWNTACDAVRQIGTNAVPWLLKMAASEDSTAKRRLILWLNAHPQYHLHIRPAKEKREQAQWGFMILEDKGKSAVPTLIQWTSDKNAERRRLAMGLLNVTDPSNQTLLPIFQRLVKDADWNVKSFAAESMLSRYPQEAANEGLDKLFPDEKRNVDEAHKYRTNRVAAKIDH
jgi:hypothetical protein